MHRFNHRKLTCSLVASLFITISSPSSAWQLEPTDESSSVKVWTEPMPNSNFKAFKGEVVINGDTWRVYRDQHTGDEIIGDAISWKIPLIRDVRVTMSR